MPAQTVGGRTKGGDIHEQLFLEPSGKWRVQIVVLHIPPQRVQGLRIVTNREEIRNETKTTLNIMINILIPNFLSRHRSYHIKHIPHSEIIIKKYFYSAI